MTLVRGLAARSPNDSTRREFVERNSLLLLIEKAIEQPW